MVTSVELLTQTLNGLAIGFSIALLAIGLTLVFGVMDIVNFAHGEFYMISTYALLISLPFVGNIWIAYLLGISAACALAVIIERLTLKPIRNRDPVHSLIVTFALVLLLPQTVATLYSSRPQRLTSPFTGNTDLGLFTYSTHRIMVILISLLLIAAIWVVLQRTRAGIIIRASAQDLEMARVNGISGDRVYLGVFVVGAVLAGAASIFLAPIYGVYPTMGVDVVIEAFIVVIVGGLGSVEGAVVVALLFGLITALSIFWVPAFMAEMLKFGFLITVLLVRPQGLIPMEEV